MSAAYLIRFDDICPTMNWSIWKEIEQLLVEAKVSPILAVVPDNQDESLKVDTVHPGFWDEVRSWQARGWAIAVHGYQHRYVSSQAGLIGVKGQSEFAGLSEAEQESKLEKALAIFRREGIRPEGWIAPSHSFDMTTLRLLKKFHLDVVSDGFSLYPYSDALGITHIPQQLWRFRRMPFGLWTVCYHHNGWTGKQVARLRTDLKLYQEQMTSLRRVLEVYRHRNRSLSDRLFFRLWKTAIQTKRAGA